MSDRDPYERKIEAMLPEWTDKIAFMESRSGAIAPEKRAAYAELIARMKNGHRDAFQRLAEAKAAPEAGWREAHAKLARAWADLTNAYEKALCQFEGVKN